MNTMIPKIPQIKRNGRIGRSLVALSRDLIGIVAVGLVTLLGLWLGGRGDITNIAIAILFVIAIVSMRFGYRAALFAAGAGALCFDYFFLPPYESIRITHFRDMLTDAAMFCVAVLISTLNERLRKQAQAACLSL